MSHFKLLAAAAALTLTGGLAACGKTGPLDRPGPLFGAERATTADADEAQRQAQDPNRPVDTVDPRQRDVDPAPPRSVRIEGTPDPNRPAPQGAIPDPYANPRR